MDLDRQIRIAFYALDFVLVQSFLTGDDILVMYWCNPPRLHEVYTRLISVLSRNRSIAHHQATGTLSLSGFPGLRLSPRRPTPPYPAPTMSKRKTLCGQSFLSPTNPSNGPRSEEHTSELP